MASPSKFLKRSSVKSVKNEQRLSPSTKESKMSDYNDVNSAATTFERAFTTKETALILGFSVRTISKLFDAGKIKGFRIPGGRDRRIPSQQLKRFIAEYWKEQAKQPLKRMADLLLPSVIIVAHSDESLNTRALELLASMNQTAKALSAFEAGVLLAEQRYRGYFALITCKEGEGGRLSLYKRLSVKKEARKSRTPFRQADPLAKLRYVECYELGSDKS